MTAKKLNTLEKLEMKDTVLEYITNPQFPVPPTWPRFKPLQTVGDIWEEAKDEHKFVVLVFEDDGSIVGREVILDLVDYPSVLVRTMHKKDVEKFGIIKYPSLYIINKDSSFQHLASGSGMIDSDRHRFVDKLLSMMGLFDSEGRRIKVNHDSDKHGGGEGGNVVKFQQAREDTPAKHQPIPSTVTGVHMQDLESALHYAFRQEVAICKTIDGPKLDALRNFVSALAKYFPGRGEVSRFLWKLVDYLGSLDMPLTGDSWVSAIDTLQGKEAFLPDQVHWVSCQGSQSRYRGYPCSVWTLFHVLTVAANNQQSSAVNALEVPMAIRGYMEHFFGCSECSQHFIQMASTLEKDIHRPADAVLWLWAAHNKANKRLHGDDSEDPQHPKIQFPSAQDCPECHKPPSDSDYVPGWNSSAVASFLGKFYGKENIIQDALTLAGDAAEGSRSGKEEMDWWEKKQGDGDLKKIQEQHEQKKRRKAANFALGDQVPAEKLRLEINDLPAVDYHSQRGSGLLISRWGFSRLDFGVCMVFYVMCAAIIVILYYHFIVQRKFKVPCVKYFKNSWV
ncbi:hypothetical protein V1264_006806 [Littorina saxatilis]|uniref:Sulfhydryl oxidase n=2 Tax=Littorina saxatilis TaxID=31220 RepID=A0AAN9B095_9CAEN